MNKIKTETIIRTAVLIVALINQILAISGKDTLPFYESDITQIITLAVTIGSTVWAWWKNNSFTPEAVKADEYLEELRGKEDDID